MYLLFSLISLYSTNFTKKLYESLPNTTSLPYVLFPYSHKNTTNFQLFRDFKKMIASDESIVAAPIDCLKWSSVCTKLAVFPNSFYISMPDSKRIRIKVEKELDEDSFKKLIKNVKNGNVEKIESLNELTNVVKAAPTFLLVSRTNAGDLEEKYPTFKDVAQRFIGKNVNFGFVTDPLLYEKFAHYPLISFVFVPQSFKHVSFNGEFNLENLELFVNQFRGKMFDEQFNNDDKLSFVVVNEKIDENIVEKTNEIQDVIPLKFINSTKRKLLSKVLCGKEEKCNCIIDYSNIKIIKIDNDFSRDSILQLLNQFQINWEHNFSTNNLLYRIQVYLLLKGSKVLSISLFTISILIILSIFVIGQSHL